VVINKTHGRCCLEALLTASRHSLTWHGQINKPSINKPRHVNKSLLFKQTMFRLTKYNQTEHLSLISVHNNFDTSISPNIVIRLGEKG